jgi:hypothetical protein
MVFQDNKDVTEALTAEPGDQPRTIPDLQAVIPPPPPENIVRNGGAQWIVLSKTARYMYQKVQVLAVGQSQLLQPGESTGTTEGAAPAQNNTGLITFNVPPVAAQWIATGTTTESGFYLSLVAKDYQPRPLAPLPVVTDVLPGEDPAKLTPYFEDQK